jgi:hypothetical protein
MPKTLVIFFQEEDGSVPVLEWLDNLSRKAQNKCFVRIERLGELGFELRRPEADYLRDGIYELRARFRKANYRILYSFNDKDAVLINGVTKESVVDPKDIDIAINRMHLFSNNRKKHSYIE